MPLRTEIFHPSPKHSIQAVATDGEREEKMLLLLPYLNGDALGRATRKVWSEGVLFSFLPTILCNHSVLEKRGTFY